MFKKITKIAVGLLIATSLSANAGGPPSASDYFITIWDLAKGGSGNNDQLTFEVQTTGIVDYSWETFPNNTLAGAGTFTGSTFSVTGMPANQKIKLKIAPTNFKRINMYNGSSGQDNLRLIDITQWGTTAWSTMRWAFAGCANLAGSGASDVPDLSNVTDMGEMFLEASLFNHPIGNWNTANVTNMTGLFGYTYAFNQSIGGWNTSNVTDMSGMFYYAKAFNQDLSAWGSKLNPTVDLSNFLDNSGMNGSNYEFLLNGFNAGTVTGRSLEAAGIRYCSASAARANLITTGIGNKNWTITDAGLASNTTIVTQPLASASLPTGTAQIFTVSALGGNLTYIWSNGLSTNNTMSTSVAGVYFVTVTGSCGTKVSKAANLNTEFITLWDLSKLGTGNNDQLTFDVETAGTVNYTWETFPNNTLTGLGTFTGTTFLALGLPANQKIKLKIAPTNFQRINLVNATDQTRIIDIMQWGTTAWTSMNSAFAYCFNLAGNGASDVPNLSGVEDMSYMFGSSELFNHPIGNWNTTNVTDMSGLFYEAKAFNQSIGGWNTANVKNMSNMFQNAERFNQSIGDWNTNIVTNMVNMFNGAIAFNQSIGGWNTSNVTNMSGMFQNASVFNQSISGWNTGNVTNMSVMFRSAFAFNQSISGWNTGNVTNMSGMFRSAFAFNQTIGGWNTANVTNMNSMFANASAFILNRFFYITHFSIFANEKTENSIDDDLSDRGDIKIKRRL